MNICVLGLWHLGSVISASVASKGHKVIGIDQNTKNAIFMTTDFKWLITKFSC